MCVNPSLRISIIKIPILFFNYSLKLSQSNHKHMSQMYFEKTESKGTRCQVGVSLYPLVA